MQEFHLRKSLNDFRCISIPTIQCDCGRHRHILHISLFLSVRVAQLVNVMLPSSFFSLARVCVSVLMYVVRVPVNMFVALRCRSHHIEYSALVRALFFFVAIARMSMDYNYSRFIRCHVHHIHFSLFVSVAKSLPLCCMTTTTKSKGERVDLKIRPLRVCFSFFSSNFRFLFMFLLTCSRALICLSFPYHTLITTYNRKREKRSETKKKMANRRVKTMIKIKGVCDVCALR